MFTVENGKREARETEAFVVGVISIFPLSSLVGCMALNRNGKETI